MPKKLLTAGEVAQILQDQIEEAQENGVHLTNNELKEISGRKRLTLAHKAAVAESGNSLGYTVTNTTTGQIWAQHQTVPDYSEIKDAIDFYSTE